MQMIKKSQKPVKSNYLTQNPNDYLIVEKTSSKTHLG